MEENSIVFRRYAPADQKTILTLHYQALEEIGILDRDKGRGWDLFNIEKVYFQNGGEFLVGIINNQVIAMGGLRRINATTGKIVRMRVHPVWRRKGVGGALLDKLEQRAKELGYETLILDTMAVRTGAQQFYVKKGYSEHGRGKMGGREVVYFEKNLHI